LLIKKCAEKPQDDVITKFDAPLRLEKIKIKQFKAEDIIPNKTMICAGKYLLQGKMCLKIC